MRFRTVKGMAVCAAASALALLIGGTSQSEDPGETAGRGGYVIVTDIAESDAWYEAVSVLAKHRDATVVTFDPERLDDLGASLAKLQPRFVAVVVKPEVIDTNFIRRFLMMSTRLDDDPFCDFACGYITGATAGDAVKFVRNMMKAEAEGLPEKFTYTCVTSGKSGAGKGSDPAWLNAAGYETARVAMGYKDDRDVLKGFLREHLPDLEGQGLIKMTGCGDPERIWLFEDRRNSQREKHWPYDPKKVGQNPGDEMFWIDTATLKGLNLYPAVLTSGTCHCGSLRRVYVEGDIVSTFGRSDKVEVYEMPAEKSLGLAWLSAGITAAILPVGPNHGWRTDVEVLRMYSTGAPLGEVMRSCYDELVLAYGGEIKLGLYDVEAGRDADADVTAMMRGGAANRVLFGDPAFAPFRKLDVAPLAVSELAKAGDGSYSVECEVLNPNAPDWVDQFDCGQYRSRVFFTVDLPEELAASGLRSVGPAGEPTAMEEVRWAEERDGKRVRLHIGAFASKDAYKDGLGASKGQKLLFRLEPAQNEKERRRIGSTGPTHKPENETTQPEAPALDAGALAEKALDSPWGYEWTKWKFQDVLDFIVKVNESYGKNLGVQRVGKIAFELDESARPAAEKIVSLKLESESLRGGLDRLCEELGLSYELDKNRGVLRFTKKK
ncbi:MAG: hypothetical protein HYY18_00685 [Planctomycetes bacterium]|nr:hypothetical protein [Planctomycetota bacterium]